ncbi:MAG: hypothetical protein G8345_01150 [Magnetococcales bacterium]|nr:hypothetical protein [Magnetococcales bacterium]NGZ25477.1 hypothetical protein [Magnetococcales bacterium]
MATFSQFFTPPVRQEKGSILLIVLVLMLVLATIGLQSMSSTSLQERMTANTLDKDISFQSAETALRTAEEWIESQAGRPTAVSTCSSNPCNVWTQGTISYSSNYVNSTFWSTYARPYNSASATTPYYIIEQLTDTYTDTSSTGDSVKTGTGGSSSDSTAYFYRITARGGGNSGTSIIVLQSVYAKTF